MAVIQEQTISKKNIKKHVFNVEDDDICWIRCVKKETIHHIILGSDGLSPTKYFKSHDKIFKYIHVLLLLEHENKNPVEFPDPDWSWGYQQQILRNCGG